MQLTEKQKELISSFNPYGMNCLVRRMPIESRTAGGIAQSRSQHTNNRWCELVKKGPGTVGDMRDVCTGELQCIESTEANAGDIVSIFQAEDKFRLDFSISDHFIVPGNVIEGRMVNEGWRLPFASLPKSLQEAYTSRGYSY